MNHWLKSCGWRRPRGRGVGLLGRGGRRRPRHLRRRTGCTCWARYRGMDMAVTVDSDGSYSIASPGIPVRDSLGRRGSGGLSRPAILRVPTAPGGAIGVS